MSVGGAISRKARVPRVASVAEADIGCGAGCRPYKSHKGAWSEICGSRFWRFESLSFPSLRTTPPSGYDL